MAIELVTQFSSYVDEQFSTESKKSMLTNQDFGWDGAHSVKIYKATTAKMNDYDRAGTGRERDQGCSWFCHHAGPSDPRSRDSGS